MTTLPTAFVPPASFLPRYTDEAEIDAFPSTAREPTEPARSATLKSTGTLTIALSRATNEPLPELPIASQPEVVKVLLPPTTTLPTAPAALPIRVPLSDEKLEVPESTSDAVDPALSPIRESPALYSDELTSVTACVATFGVTPPSEPIAMPAALTEARVRVAVEVIPVSPVPRPTERNPEAFSVASVTASAAAEPGSPPTTTSPLNELVSPAGPVPLPAIDIVPDRTKRASPLPAPTEIDEPVSRSEPEPDLIKAAVPDTLPENDSVVAGFVTSTAPPLVPDVVNPRFVVAVAPV